MHIFLGIASNYLIKVMVLAVKKKYGVKGTPGGGITLIRVSIEGLLEEAVLCCDWKNE